MEKNYRLTQLQNIKCIRQCLVNLTKLGKKSKI